MAIKYEAKKLVSPLKEEGVLELDYSKDTHRDYILNLFGGKDFLENKYPAVYKTLIKQTNKAFTNRNAVSGDDMKSELISPTIHYKNKDEIYFESFMKAKSFSAANSDNDKYICGEVNLHEENIRPDVTIYRKLLDEDGNELDSYLEPYDPSRDFQSQIACRISELKEERVQAAYAEFGIFKKDGHKVVKTQPLPTNESSEPLLLNFEVYRMSKSTTDDHNPLNVLYARDLWAEEKYVDKQYPENEKDEKDGTVNVCMPLSGKIEFNPKKIKKIEFAAGSQNKFALEFSDSGGVTYEYPIEDTITIDNENMVVTFAIPINSQYHNYEDWGSKLFYQRFGINTILTMNAPIMLRLFESDDTNYVYNFVVKSKATLDPNKKEVYYTSQKPMVYIPPIYVRWGCFAGETKILISKDGTEKMAQDIKEGDTVISSAGEELKVTGILVGEDAKIIHIQTEDGKILRISEGHPVATKEGPKAAVDLHPGDAIMTYADGVINEVKILYCCLVEYYSKVYGIETEKGSQMLVAEGILAGNSQAQDDTETKREHPTVELTEEDIEYITQMKALAAEINNSKQ